MHTDEYGITLSRELHACECKIKGITLSLKKLERQYGFDTDVFVKMHKEGTLKDNKDFADWYGLYESLNRWQSLRRQYHELYHMLR
ncbi:MAG: hypothetical protein EPN22_07860 [Nitrospirae bacterium]|nr:MAG: hypothetical protein EPN22_07860 [Nitrospirota bacterium]